MQYPTFFLDKIDSTNKELWRRLDSEARLDEFTVVQAGSQSAGRGMAGTTWESEPDKNLLFSVLLKPVFLPPVQQFLLNKAISLSIRDALAGLCPHTHIMIKWPNDIYADHSKIGGTLIENRILGKSMEACVAGTGINVNQTSFPESLPNPSSLALLTGKRADPRELLAGIMDSMHSFYEMLRCGHFHNLNKVYMEHLLGAEEKRVYKKDGKRFEATIVGVDEHGKLLLRDTAGKITAYGLKEVSMII